MQCPKGWPWGVIAELGKPEFAPLRCTSPEEVVNSSEQGLKFGTGDLFGVHAVTMQGTGTRASQQAAALPEIEAWNAQVPAPAGPVEPLAVPDRARPNPGVGVELTHGWRQRSDHLGERLRLTALLPHPLMVPCRDPGHAWLVRGA